METLKIVDDNCFSKLLSYVFSHERDEHPELHASKRISEKVFLGFLEKEMKVRFRDLMLASVKGKELFLDVLTDFLQEDFQFFCPNFDRIGRRDRIRIVNQIENHLFNVLDKIYLEKHYERGE